MQNLKKNPHRNRQKIGVTGLLEEYNVLYKSDMIKMCFSLPHHERKTIGVKFRP